METRTGGPLPRVTPSSFTAPPGWAALLKVFNLCLRSQTRTCPSCAPVTTSEASPAPHAAAGRASIEVMCPLWPFRAATCSAREASHTRTVPPRSPLTTRSSAQMKSITGASWPLQEAISRFFCRSQTFRLRSYPDEMAMFWLACVRARDMEPTWPLSSTHATPVAFHRQSLLSRPAERTRPSGQCDTEVTHSVCPNRLV
mmetsp:Transcript_6585/g.14078  ORF Transcript_6585/g.14078 Transcript_6585/m.14078 type:complete len:200 (+) Transcript_6585:290-889(+)